ncbi:carbohydrate ABC transporter permease [Paractinoplanes atraurantiacus]|uniref:Multiple sugar transport system permease protein n=1 Tax=Paractinoplanes atraurantiacus TaxID=1036182 RepID=A0A285J1T7_9ACTN|nr:carbohydrate ABC transporter permease [Actinoplanes atraurantiacus]SNY54178.1 multiple sugar transport system permease protein [Actinoplanes atraurantiacus]
MAVTTVPVAPAQAPATVAPRVQRNRRTSPTATILLLLGAAYCLMPVLWVLVASTKSASELFNTFTFMPSTHLFDNISFLNSYRDGLYWRWMANSALFAGVGAAASTLVSAMAGFALAKYDFRGKSFVFNLVLAGVLVPAVILAVPQYLLLAKVGMTNTYWSVLLPSMISPYGIYLCRIFAAATVPNEVLEAARMDGAGDWRSFVRVVLPMMRAGLVTVFLFQFVAIWNNYMLPFIMLGDDKLFPVTVGLSGLLNQGATQPAMYTSVVTGALLSVVPLVALFLGLQRYWRVDLGAGAVKA